jgi:tetratricopeptide (TPR) repeat protein
MGMGSFSNARRAVFLALSLLSACAAADPTAGADRYQASGGFYGSYLAGRFALNHGDFEIAATDLLQALRYTPDDSDLMLQTFIACVNAGRPEALALARHLPHNQIGQMLLANAAAKNGNWAEALETVRGVPPDGVMQLLQPLIAAWISQGAGQTDQALATLRPFLSNAHFKAVAALHSGLIADLGGRTTQAAAFYGIVRNHPAELGPRGALVVANWAFRSGHPDEAARIVREMAEGSPEAMMALPGFLATIDKRPVANALDGMAEAYATFASAVRSQQLDDLAMILTRLALDVKPTSATALLMAGEIQAGEHHLEASKALLTQGSELDDPITPVIRLRRIAVLREMKRVDEAIRETERLGRDYPDSPLPDIELGELLRSQHRYTESITAYDRVILKIKKPVPSDWVLFYSRGIGYERSGQWARAEADFNKALELSPDQPSVLNYLGYAWADMGRNLEKAKAMIELALSIRPNDGAITDSLGWVFYRQGKIPEAVKEIERAVSLEPDDPSITDHLGDVYWAAGRKIEAVYQWRRALTLDPTPEDAAKLEAKIKSHPFGTMASGQ